MRTVTALFVGIYHNFLERNEIRQGISHNLIKKQKSATDTTLKRIQAKLVRLPPRNNSFLCLTQPNFANTSSFKEKRL